MKDNICFRPMKVPYYLITNTTTVSSRSCSPGRLHCWGCTIPTHLSAEQKELEPPNEEKDG